MGASAGCHVLPTWPPAGERGIFLGLGFEAERPRGGGEGAPMQACHVRFTCPAWGPSDCIGFRVGGREARQAYCRGGLSRGAGLSHIAGQR